MIEKILSRIDEISELIRPVGWSRKIEVVETKAVREIVQEVANDGGWTPVEVAMPEEHASIFAKFKGTDKWDIGMFEKVSDDVNVTVEYTDGTRKTKTLHTCDGIWKNDSVYAQYNVIAWQPLPAPHQKGE